LPGGKSVTIASLDQLDTSVGELELCVFVIRKGIPNSDMSFTLTELIERIRKKLQNSPLALERYEELLLEACYIPNEDYETLFFDYIEYTRYKEREGFPLLTRNTVPRGINNVKYEILIESLEKYQS
jgi:hypothetical protein